ncbi:MSCRAMM family adhesin SdrC [Pseudoalteromonas sp. A3]|uniref:MSCRAMM family adhesin SdrC n=1 Tax=Pseudoalteromonas sp. A3 TaxID=142792 RepID=UPI0022201256|nr:MSCRAMM family adhesin SdrC [Pseudoalteromonas sp. A3]MCW1717375.1 MSCRAMM family adhesin SdrC [Pseudoalteromonas sp. A3]
MKIPLIYFSLLSVSSALSLLSYTTPVKAKAIQSPPHVGTWQNKDEDSDGVVDEQDDYPFDVSKTGFYELTESENNNLVETSNSLEGNFPGRVFGELDNSGDTDVFKFSFPSETIESNNRVSVIITSNDNNFYPTANLFDRSGTQLATSVDSDFKPVNSLKYFFTYIPDSSAPVFLSISSLSQQGIASYTAEVFVDNDADAMSDIKEISLGMNPKRSDTDSDGILDSYEYFVYKNGQLNTDVDNDNIPNFLDNDSDNDNIPDSVELFSDPDKDSLANFVDIDSDGNGFLDSVEAVSLDNPIDTDSDSVPNYLDIDDDGDGVFDIYDKNRLTAVDIAGVNSTSIKMYGVSTVLSEQVQLSQQSIQGQELSISGKFTAFTDYVVALQIGSEFFNISASSDEDTKIKVNIPKLSLIQTTSLNSSAFVYTVEDVRTNSSKFELLAPQVPLISEVEKIKYSKGDKIILKGWNFNNKTTAWFGDVNVPSTNFLSSKEVEFKIPDNITDYTIQLENGWGMGNVYGINIINEMSARVSIPGDLNHKLSNLYYYDGNQQLQKFSINNSNEINLPSLEDPILTLYVQKGEKYVRVLSSNLESGVPNIVSIDSTLLTWLKPFDSQLTLAKMQTDESYPRLYDYIYAELLHNIYFFEFEEEGSQAQFFAELNTFINSYKATAFSTTKKINGETPSKK